MDGYVLDRVLSFRDAVQPLEVMFGFDMVETGTAIRAVSKQGLAPAITVSEDELVEGGGDGHILALTRRQETELPDVAKLRFIEGNADYRAAVAEARRVPGATARVAQAEVAVVLDQGRAEAAADSWLQDLWVAREQAGFTLPPSRLRIDPGDVVKLERASGSRILRIERVSELTSRTCEARAFDADVFASAYVAQRHGGALGGAVAPVTGPPAIGFLDLPRLRDQDPDWAGYVAAYAKPWPGAVHLYRSPQGSGYALNTVLQAPAAAGESLEAFAAGPTGRWDRGNRLVLRLYGGAAASLPELAVFGGGNLLAIETGEGRWEVLQFADAELVGPQSWALSMLLRGQFGSEGEMAASIAAGARCLILDGAVVPVAMQAADVGLPYHYRAGPAGDDIGADTYLTLEHAFSGTGLRPYSPAHLRGRREASGDILIQWVRRTRRGGDNWALAEVALAEEREAYVVEVLDGSDEVVRTLAVDEASVRYEAAQQAADFGTPANDFAVKVYQVSATYGRGTARREIIHV
nr:phage tail protein [Rhodoligotrophos appendicifer]